MAEDPTMIATLVNMVVNGCKMHSGIFETMGKGTPEFSAQGNHVLITLSDGTYKIDVVYSQGGGNPRAVPESKR